MVFSSSDGAEGDAASVENGGGTRSLAFEELLRCYRPSVLEHLIEPRDQPLGSVIVYRVKRASVFWVLTAACRYA